MKPRAITLHGGRRERGFSLIELIMAIVIISVGAVLTLQALITSARSIPYDTEVQLATQAAQACAEHVLGLREIQTNGWNTVPAAANTRCDSITPPTGYTRNLSIVAIAAGGNVPCTVAGGFSMVTPCRRVTITVSKTGGLVPAVTYEFTMVNY